MSRTQESVTPDLEFTLRNPGPVVLEAVQSRLFREVCSDRRLLRVISDGTKSPAYLLGLAGGSALQLKQYLPETTRVRLSPGGSGHLTALWDIVVAEDLLHWSRKQADVDATSIASLQRHLIAGIERSSRFNLRARLDYVKSTQATAILRSISDALDELSADADPELLSFVDRDDGFDLSFDFGKVSGLSDPELLPYLHVTRDENDPMTGAIVAAARRLRYVVEARQDGGAIDLTLRAASDPAPANFANTSDPGPGEGGPLFWMRWSLGSAVDQLEKIRARVDATLPAVLRRSFVGENFSSTELDSARLALGAISLRGEARVDRSGSELCVDWDAELPAPIPTLSATGLARFVPPDAAIVRLDAGVDLATWMVDWIDTTRSRLQARDLETDSAQGSSLLRRFEPAVAGIEAELHRAREVFRLGSGWIVTAEGILALRRPEQRGWSSGSFPALAVIGRVVDQGRGLAAARTMLTLIARAGGGDESDFEVGGVKLEGDPPLLRLKESRLATALGDEVKTDGDLQIHAFALGEDMIALSTSVRLSQRLIAAGAGARDQGIATRAASGAVTAVVQTSGRRLGELVIWTLALFADRERKISDFALPTLDRVAAAIPPLARLIGPIRFRTEVLGTEVHGQGTFHFGEPGLSCDEALAEVRAKNTKPWPDGKALLATGSQGRFEGRDGPFRFVVARDARFATRVTHEFGTGNAWDGRESTTWDPRFGTSISAGFLSELSRLWAASISGAWAEPDAPIARSLLDADDDEFTFLLTVDAARCAMRLVFDRRRGVLRSIDALGHRAFRRGIDSATTLSDYRLVEGRMLPHRVEVGVEGATDAYGYPIESWALVDADSESFRLAEPGRETIHFDSGVPIELPLIVEKLRAIEVPLVKVELDGRPVWLELHLSEFDSFVSPKVLSDLDGKPLSDGQRAHFLLHSLAIGALHIDGPVVRSRGVFLPVAGREVAGSLGIGAFRELVVEIDLEKPALILHPQTEDLGIDSGRWRRAEFDGSVLWFEARMGAEFSDFVTFRLDQELLWLSAFGRERLPREALALLDRRSRLDGLELGGRRLPVVVSCELGTNTFTVQDCGRLGVLGFNALSGQTLVIDLPRHRYVLR